MPRVCTVCAHADREAIDTALVAGTPLREISALYRVSEDAVARHAAKHIPATLTKAQDAADAAHADDLLAQVRGLQARALAILDAAEALGDLKTALAAIRETRGTLELLAKLTGDLQQEGTVNIIVNPQWISIRAVLLDALAPFPDARVAVASALVALEAPPTIEVA